MQEVGLFVLSCAVLAVPVGLIIHGLVTGTVIGLTRFGKSPRFSRKDQPAQFNLVMGLYLAWALLWGALMVAPLSLHSLMERLL